ncbi:MAG TPA: hypothetical protein VGI17_09140 [Solirubrobacterales bacterium]|jgi:hypothetical protein
MIVIRALIGWLEGGERPGVEAIEYLERGVKSIPRHPDADELAQRNVYLAGIAELGGDEAAASRLWWDSQRDPEEDRCLLDFQGRTIRAHMGARGLTIGEVAERSQIDTVTPVSLLFGLEESSSRRR